MAQDLSSVRVGPPFPIIRIPGFCGPDYPDSRIFQACRPVPIQFPDFPECRFADYPDSRIFHRKTVWKLFGMSIGYLDIGLHKKYTTAAGRESLRAAQEDGNLEFERERNAEGDLVIWAFIKEKITVFGTKDVSNDDMQRTTTLIFKFADAI